MSAWNAMDRGTKVVLLLLGGTAATGVGYIGWQTTRPVPVAEVQADAVAAASEDSSAATGTVPVAEATDTAAAETTATGPTPDEAAASLTEAQPEVTEVLPAIDTWRVTAEGEAVVSGTALPGAVVEVLVDGAVVAKGDVAGSGDFALLFTLPPNPDPSLMWLSMTAPEASAAVPSEEMVALGPIAGPKPAETEAVAATGTEDVAAAEPAAPPPALLLSDEGAVVLQDPAPDAGTPDAGAPDATAMTAGVMIDTIAYTPEGEVQVGGHGAPGASIRLYLDNTEKLTIPVPDTGLWAATLPDTAPGVYTLRADQLDPSGKVTSRFETPFKRETLADLAAASGEAAAPAATGEVVAAEASVDPAPKAAEATAAAGDPASEPATEPTATAADPVAEAAPAPDTAPEPAADPAPELVAEAAAAPVTVTVQPGFTLWGIAQERYGDGVMFVQVFEANRDKIKNPDLIYPGQVFAVPATALP